MIDTMNTLTISIALIIVLAIIGAGYFYWTSISAPKAVELNNTMPPKSDTPSASESQVTSAKSSRATIETNKGTIVVEFYSEDAPKTVANFVKLAGEKYYDGLTFHRVIKGFMIQGGDPNCTPARASGACGTGGPGYQFADELNPQTKSYQTGYQRGVMAMANAGPNTNGSQFFIMHADNPLPHSYTIFGKVISGLDVIDAIANTPVDQNDRPKSAVVIIKVTIN